MSADQAFLYDGLPDLAPVPFPDHADIGELPQSLARSRRPRLPLHLSAKQRVEARNIVLQTTRKMLAHEPE